MRKIESRIGSGVHARWGLHGTREGRVDWWKIPLTLQRGEKIKCKQGSHPLQHMRSDSVKRETGDGTRVPDGAVSDESNSRGDAVFATGSCLRWTLRDNHQRMTDGARMYAQVHPKRGDYDTGKIIGYQDIGTPQKGAPECPSSGEAVVRHQREREVVIWTLT
jgi:hypothetical protein